MTDPLAQVKAALTRVVENADNYRARSGDPLSDPKVYLSTIAAARAALPALDTLGEELARLREERDYQQALCRDAMQTSSHRYGEYLTMQVRAEVAESYLARCQDALREAVAWYQENIGTAESGRPKTLPIWVADAALSEAPAPAADGMNGWRELARSPADGHVFVDRLPDGSFPGEPGYPIRGEATPAPERAGENARAEAAAKLRAGAAT